MKKRKVGKERKGEREKKTNWNEVKYNVCKTGQNLVMLEKNEYEMRHEYCVYDVAGDVFVEVVEVLAVQIAAVLAVIGRFGLAVHCSDLLML